MKLFFFRALLGSLILLLIFLVGKGKFSFLTILCGVFLINGNSIHTQSNDFGMFCGLIAAVMYALMVMLNKKATGINGLENAMLQLFVSFVTVAAFIAWKQ